MLVPVIDLTGEDSTGRDSSSAVLLKFRFGYAGSPVGYPAKMTIHPPPRERGGESVAGY